MNEIGTRLPLLLLAGLLGFGPVCSATPGSTNGPPIEEQPGPEPCVDPPAEVSGVTLSGAGTLTWTDDPCASSYNVYRGTLEGLAVGHPASCAGYDITSPAFSTTSSPGSGAGFFYLVTSEATEESTPGATSGGAERSLLGSCDQAVRTHVLDRTGFGGNEWSRDRLDTLGVQAYVDEQLDPASIDEASNVELNDALLAIEPPTRIQDLQGISIVRAVYGRRQLEQAATIFWTNHFNTDYQKSFAFFNFYNPDTARKRLEASTLHYRETLAFRDEAFNGSFRSMLDASAYSAAMIIYLDTKDSLAGNPNENYARELLELHTLGVDGGYDDFDIVELARVFTGWNVCKKIPALADDPAADCIPFDQIGTDTEPEGLWVANFRPFQHDCGSKVLFQGDPEEVTIPATCDSPAGGIADAQLALDAIAAHPSTARFIAGKLLEKFVGEDPTTEMVDAAVAEWNDAGNPQGVGDLRAVLAAALGLAEFHEPDHFRAKVKTPLEHVASAFRAVRGNTDGVSQVRNYLKRMDHLLHENPVPTGYPETAESWLDTNNTLERHNFGADLTDGTGAQFGADVIGLLQDNGIATSPGNAGAIVDFLADVLFGVAISPAERQAAITFLETDDTGAPSPGYNNLRIRQTAGYMLGYAQFQEQ